jgi:nitrate reductase assembly molybdenum cofactor insertion protein NarJ
MNVQFSSSQEIPDWLPIMLEGITVSRSKYYDMTLAE